MLVNRCLLFLLAAALPVCAQPFFECQAPVPFLETASFDCDGVTSTVNGSGNGDAYVDASSGTSGTATFAPGFPTQGNQFLVVPGNNVNSVPPPAAGVPLARPLPLGVSEVQIPIPPGATDVAITWDFYNGEFGAYAIWNDGCRIDIVDPATGLSVLLIASADTFSLLAPGGATASWMSPNGSAESGLDVFTDGPQTTCVLLPSLPAGAYLSVAAWTGGDDVISSACVVDDIQWNTGCPPVSTPNMPNSLAATLSFTGASCLPAGTIPEQRLVVPGSQTQMTISTPANGQQPYALFTTLGAGTVTGPGIPTPYGIVDLDPAAIASGGLSVVIDGIGGTRAVDLFLGNTGPMGTLALPFSVPATGSGTLASFQAIVIDPGSAFGLTLSAATQLDFSPAGGALPPSFVGSTPTPGYGQDSDTQIVFTSGLSIPFYGTVYTDVWIGGNGYLSFGGPPATTNWVSTPANFQNDVPRIAVLWDELGVGSCAYTETATDLVVSWIGLPEYNISGGPTNDFAVKVDSLGAIQFAYGIAGATGTVQQDPLIGITPGLTSPVGIATGASIDLSALAIGIGYVGTPTEAIFESFPGQIDLAPPCGSTTTPQIQFAPNGGAGGYTAF